MAADALGLALLETYLFTTAAIRWKIWLFGGCAASQSEATLANLYANSVLHRESCKKCQLLSPTITSF